MPKLKIPRKSTAIDMTAMCDVAFLLLSFFIFTAKFKKPSDVPIIIPATVTTDELDTVKKGMFHVYCEVGKGGEVLMGVEEQYMDDLVEEISALKQISLSKTQKEAFAKKTTVGMPFDGLPDFLTKSATGNTPKVVGIPVLDSTDNQLKDWIAAAANVNLRTRKADPVNFNVFITADKESPFEVVDKVMTTWSNSGKDNFKLVTSLKDIPIGTELYEKRRKGGRIDKEEQ
jgi:biopolymer transport protein ExbD